uniref:Uncharacterized protein n=1 Tax=Cannabis sativa TaxID=3483 RepID=A0A803PUF5_CANSA
MVQEENKSFWEENALLKSKVEILKSVQHSTTESQSRFRVPIPSMQSLDYTLMTNRGVHPIQSALFWPTSSDHKNATKPNNTPVVNYNDYWSRWVSIRGINSNTWTLFGQIVAMTPEDMIEQMVTRKLEGMETMIHRIPRVLAPIKKSLPSSFTDSPLMDAIALVEMPKKFIFPSMKMCDRTTGPNDHIASYNYERLVCVRGLVLVW